MIVEDYEPEFPVQFVSNKYVVGVIPKIKLMSISKVDKANSEKSLQGIRKVE